MQHVDLASSAERMVEARQKIVPGNFVTVMTRLNPWWWVQGGDAGPTLADSASGTQPGPSGNWNAFPMPPPKHHGGTSGVDHAPHTLVDPNGTALFQQTGATTDGRKAFGIAATGSRIQTATWAATSTTNWALPDDPPIDGGNFEMSFWYKFTGRMSAGNSQAGTATTTVLGFGSQLSNPCACFFWKDDRFASPPFNWAMRDSGNTLWTGGWGSSPNDGQWHALGAIITCDGGRNQTCTLYDNGVSLGTVTLTGNVSTFAGLSSELLNFYLGGECDFFIGPAGGFDLQDVAITTPTAASPGFHASDFAALYAAR